MARCGCANEICACLVVGGPGIIVSGVGSEENPYKVESEFAGMNLIVQDTDTVDLTLTGSGTPGEPYVLSADSTLDFTSPDSLEWRNLGIGTTDFAVPLTLTQVPLTVDNGGNGITATAGRMTVTKSGVYHVVGTLSYTGQTTSFVIQQLVQRRAGTAIATREMVTTLQGPDWDTVAVAGDFACVPNDTFEIRVSAQFAGISAAANRCHLVAHRLAGPGLDGQPGAPGQPGPPGPTGSANVPIGTVLPWAGPTAPAHFLFCDGRELLRADYPDLWAVIGANFGARDTAHFNLPNLNTRVILGVGPAAWGNASYTQTGGWPSHGHGIPDHIHGTTQGDNQMLQPQQGGGVWVSRAIHTHLTGGASPGLSASPTEEWPPFLALNHIIRVTPTGAVDNMTVRFFKGSAASNTQVVYGANANMAFTIRTDPSNAWNVTNNNWVVPAPGRYRVSIAHKATAGAVRSMRIMRNGAPVTSSPDPVVALAGGFFMDVLDLSQGDTIAIQPTAAFTTPADGTGVTNTYLIIESVGLQAAP